MLDQIPTGDSPHSKARTDGVGSSDMLGGGFADWFLREQPHLEEWSKSPRLGAFPC